MNHRHRNMILTTLQHPKTMTRRMRRVMTRRMTQGGWQVGWQWGWQGEWKGDDKEDDKEDPDHIAASEDDDKEDEEGGNLLLSLLPRSLLLIISDLSRFLTLPADIFTTFCRYLENGQFMRPALCGTAWSWGRQGDWREPAPSLGSSPSGCSTFNVRM